MSLGWKRYPNRLHDMLQNSLPKQLKEGRVCAGSQFEDAVHRGREITTAVA